MNGEMTDPYLTSRRRRQMGTGSSAMPLPDDSIAALGRGEQVDDPYVSQLIQTGSYIGTRPQTPVELEAQKQRHRLGLDGTDPRKRSGTWQGSTPFL